MCEMLAASESQKIVGTATIPYIGPNPRRRSLIIFVPSGNRLTISQRSDVALGTGLTLSNSTSPFIMRYSDFGDFMQGQLFACADVAGVQTAYVEVTDSSLKIDEMIGNNYQRNGVGYGYPARRGSGT
jgi:hypothetical protein